MKRKSCTDRVPVLNWITLSLLFYSIFEMRSASFSRQLSVAFMACLWQLAFSLQGRLYTSLVDANSDLHFIIIFFVTPQPNSGVGHHVVEVSRSHTITHTHTHTHTR